MREISIQLSVEFEDPQAREPEWWEPVNAEEGTPEPFGESMGQVAEPEIPPLSKNGINHVKMDSLVNQGGTAGNYLSSLQQASCGAGGFLIYVLGNWRGINEFSRSNLSSQ